MAYNFYISFLLVLIQFPVNSQVKGTDPAAGFKKNYRVLIARPAADIYQAIEIKDSSCGPFNVSLGYGHKIEVLQDINCKDCSEENSLWFKFRILKDTLLSFDIVPVDSTDDYDFILFKEGTMIKPDSILIKKMRSCFSQCSSKSGLTGMSKYALNSGIGSGPGPAYVSALRVKAKETYYLMVNLSSQYIQPGTGKMPSGFHLYFYEQYPGRVPIIIENVLFNEGSSNIKTASYPNLNKLASWLLSTNDIIEVRGHTDNVGDPAENEKLSTLRAKAVVDHLVSKGVPKSRLFYAGFGSSKPIASNNSIEGRMKNRRVEFIRVLR